MGILFRKNNSKRRVIKRQEGGAIPVYSAYQVESKAPVVWNPASLLAKYQAAAPTKTSTSTTGGTKKPDDLKREVKGLASDAHLIRKNLQSLEAQYRQVATTNPGSSLEQQLRSQYDFESSEQLNQASVQQEKFKANYTNMMDKYNSSNQPAYVNGSYYAKKYNTDTKSYEYGKVSKEDLADESKAWIPMTFKEVAQHRELNTYNPIWSMNGKMGVTAADDIGHGRSLEWVVKEKMTPVFNEAAKTALKQTKKFGNIEITNDNVAQYFKEYIDMHSEDSNENQIKAASRVIRASLDGPSLDALRGYYGRPGFEGGNSDEEVENRINQFIANQMLIHFDTKIETSETRVLPESPEFAGDGSGGGSMKELAMTVVEASGGVGKPNYETYEEVLDLEIPADEETSEKGRTSLITTVVTNEAPETSKLIDRTASLSMQVGDSGKPGAISSAAILDKATFFDGTPFNETSGYTLDDEMQNPLQWAMAADKTLRFAMIPMGPDGKPIGDEKIAKAAKELTSRIQEIEKEKQQAMDDYENNTGSKMSPANPQYTAFNDKIKAAYKEVFATNELDPSAFTMEPTYIMDVLIPDPDGSITKFGFKGDGKGGRRKPSSGEMNRYKALFGGEENEDNLLDQAQWDFWAMFSDGDTDQVIEDNLAITTILVPARDIAAIQIAGGGKVWTPAYNVDAGNMIANQNKSRTVLTIEDLGRGLIGKGSYGSSYSPFMMREMIK